MSTCAVDMYVCVCVYGCQHIKTDALDIFKRSYRFNELLPRTPLTALRHSYTHSLTKGLNVWNPAAVSDVMLAKPNK